MCGRYTLKTPTSELASILGAEPPEALVAPRYNIAPSQQVLVLTNARPRKLSLVRWGLIPFWAKDAKLGAKMINARGETLGEKPAYRDALRRRRCVVPADGFFEWKEGPLGKVPLYVHRRTDRPLLFAGLWDTWRPAGAEPVTSCTIVTSAANALMAPYHQRMPVILSEDELERWLEPEPVDPTAVLPLVAPYRHDDLELYEVSRLVNSPKNDSPACLVRADEPLRA